MIVGYVLLIILPFAIINVLIQVVELPLPTLVSVFELALVPLTAAQQVQASPVELAVEPLTRISVSAGEVVNPLALKGIK